MKKLTEINKLELIDLAEILSETFGKTTDDGVLIDQVKEFYSGDVLYVDASNGELIKKISASAYVAEFYKVAVGSLDDADFDNLSTDVYYAGNGALGNLMVTSAIGYDGLRCLTTDAAAELSRKYPMDSGDYC